MSRAVVWFRRDLRLGDNPAWGAATSRHDEVTPLFVIDPYLWRNAGEHRRTQLLAHLRALDEVLGRAGGRLHVRIGDPTVVIPELAADAAGLFWNDDVTPYSRQRDAAVADAVAVPIIRYHGCLVQPPGAVRTGDGSTYQVFTPFHRKWEETDLPDWPEPGDAVVTGDPGEGLPELDGDPLMAGGESAAAGRLEGFLHRVDEYHELRDRPDLDTTSRLSADLKYGTISPRRIIDRVGDGSKGRRAFVRQLAWRDFYAHLMAAEPRLVAEPMRTEYAALAWRNDAEEIAAWREGMTGYPLVDAGMRQLLAEGWMHNRVRMVTGSFLVKDLLVDWRIGERHFRHYLVDGDLSQNVGNWQWVAGTGADAAPYFRIFNPVTQSKKFDPDGSYIRRWVPELADVAAPAIHAPWEAKEEDLTAAGIALGTDYPQPIVDHAVAREATLAAYERARR